MSGTLRNQKPTPAQIALRESMLDAMKDAGDSVTPMEQLAVAAYLVGQLIALQDQERVTPEMAMALVEANMQAGNADVIDFMNATPGGTA